MKTQKKKKGGSKHTSITKQQAGKEATAEEEEEQKGRARREKCIRKKQGEDIEGFLVDSFLNRVNQEFQPYAQAVQTGQLRPTTASTTQSERNIAKTKARLDKLGNITKNNYEEFLNLVEDFQGKYIARVENGILQVADNKTGDIRVNIDLSKPSLAKQKLANLAGVTGYSGSTYDAKSLIQQYSK